MTTTNDAPAPAPSGSRVREDGLNISVSREWFDRKAQQEGDTDPTTGPSITGTVNPSPEQIAEYERLAFEALPVWAQNEIKRLRASLASDASPRGETAAWREAFIGATAALSAAISLLERTPKAKKAAPSDRMFDQMLCDYRKALDEARAALAPATEGRKDKP